MMFDNTSFGKMPVAMKIIIGFALVALGVCMILGDIDFSTLKLSVGVLFLVSGIPSILEAAMDMVEKQKQEDAAAAVAKEKTA